MLEAAATVTRGRRVGYTISPPQEFVFEAGLQMATHLERGGDRKGGREGGGRKVEMAHTRAHAARTHTLAAPWDHKEMSWRTAAVTGIIY